METVLLFIVALLAGVGVGVLSGMLGIGGGVIMVPLFRLGFSLEPIGATATSLFCILPTSVSGAITHVRDRTCTPSVGVVMGIGGAVLSPVGVWLAAKSPSIAIMAVTALIIVYSSVTMIRKALALDSGAADASADSGAASSGGMQAASDRASSDQGAAGQAASGQTAPDQVSSSKAASIQTASDQTDSCQAVSDQVAAGRAAFAQPASSQTASGKAAAGQAASAQNTLSRSASSRAAAGQAASNQAASHASLSPAFVLRGLAIGACAGVCSGYAGVGGGFLMVPMMISWLGMPMSKASGTSLIAIAILAVPSIIEQVALGNVAFFAGIAVACGSIPGAFLGARLVRRIPEKQLRLFFAGVLIASAVALVAKELVL